MPHKWPLHGELYAEDEKSDWCFGGGGGRLSSRRCVINNEPCNRASQLFGTVALPGTPIHYTYNRELIQCVDRSLPLSSQQGLIQKAKMKIK